MLPLPADLQARFEKLLPVNGVPEQDFMLLQGRFPVVTPYPARWIYLKIQA